MGSFKFIPAVWQGLALALALGGSLPATAQVWSIQNLGNLSGNYTNALGVNIHGEVTGYSYVGNNPHGFRWTLATGMVDLGVLDSGNNPQSAGNAINDSGLVAGFAYAEDNYGNPYTYAVTWTGTTMTVLNDFSGVYPAYRAMAVNASGEIAGFSYVDMVPDTHACTWPGPKDLGTLGGQASFGLGINDAGQVVGTSQFQTGNPVNHAFFYAGSMQDLGVFPGDTYSTAYAINNRPLA